MIFQRVHHWPLTRCQVVTPLLYCTCMMVWSGFAHTVNGRECCLYYFGNVSSAK